MPFKQDFIELLTKYGRLPFISPEEPLSKIAQLEQKVKELEAELSVSRKQADTKKIRKDFMLNPLGRLLANNIEEKLQDMEAKTRS